MSEFTLLALVENGLPFRVCFHIGTMTLLAAEGFRVTLQISEFSVNLFAAMIAGNHCASRWRQVPALANHVVRVILRRTEKEMIRTYAVSDIASMTNEHLRRHRAKSDFIHQAMCRVRPLVDGDHTVSVAHCIASPQPARICLRDLLDKSRSRAFFECVRVIVSHWRSSFLMNVSDQSRVSVNALTRLAYYSI